MGFYSRILITCILHPHLLLCFKLVPFYHFLIVDACLRSFMFSYLFCLSLPILALSWEFRILGLLVLTTCSRSHQCRRNGRCALFFHITFLYRISFWIDVFNCKCQPYKFAYLLRSISNCGVSRIVGCSKTQTIQRISSAILLPVPHNTSRIL